MHTMIGRKTEAKKTLWRCRHRYEEDNIKTEHVKWVQVTLDRSVRRGGAHLIGL